MISWCAYCQRFNGEKPPYDEAEMTHGMCASCAAMDPEVISRKIADLRPVQQFLQEMWKLGRTAPLAHYRAVLERARELRISSADLLAGLVSPLLVALGRRWEQGSISIAEEHRFTAFYEAVMAEVRLRDARLHPYLDAEHPDVLLVNAGGNYHTVGPRIVEVWLAERGISSRTVVPGLPAREVAAVVADCRPALVGLSISMADQLPALRETLSQLTGSDARILVGGYAVKAGWVTAADAPGALLVPHVLDLATQLPPRSPPVPA